MTRSDMIRLLTAFVNLNCCKELDEFSGDYLMTLEEGNKLLSFIEDRGMLPPMLPIPEYAFQADHKWEPEE